MEILYILLILIVLAIVLFGKFSKHKKKDYHNKTSYVVNPSFFTRSELILFQNLTLAFEKNQYQIFAKVALNRIIKPINQDDYQYIGAKSVDFIVIDKNNKVILAVDIYKKNRSKTKIKNDLTKKQIITSSKLAYYIFSDEKLPTVDSITALIKLK